MVLTFLHPSAELANGEVTLDEGTKARIETQSPGFSIAQKLALERKPGPASIERVADKVVEVQGDRSENPGEDHTVKAQPRGGLDNDRGVDEDVVI